MPHEKKKSGKRKGATKFEQEAIQGLTEGKGLIGEHGVLTGMIGRLLSAAFEGEMDAHLDQEKKRSNRATDTDKTVRTALGPVSVRPPRDRNGSFEPTLNKWDRSLAPELENQIRICTARAPATRTLGTI